MHPSSSADRVSYVAQFYITDLIFSVGNSITLGSRCKGEVSAPGVAYPYLINEVISTLPTPPQGVTRAGGPAY